MTDAITEKLYRQTAHLGLIEIAPLGGGLEFLTYQAVDPQGQKTVLRFTEQRFQSNANDRNLDMRILLRQEYEVAKLLGPDMVARPIELIEAADSADGFDILVSAYIDDDGSALDCRDLGRFLRQMHSSRLPEFDLHATGGGSWQAALASRMAERWQELAVIHGEQMEPLDRDKMTSALSSLGGAALLHMDVRRPNTRCASGAVSALLDWSNTMIGPPELELARIYESAKYPENQLNFDALTGSYLNDHPQIDFESTAFLLCRFDTALMLALVFNSEAPDRERGPKAADHAIALFDQLRGEIVQ